MDANRLKLIFVKELKDFLRDRRTVVSLMLAPILVMPVFMLGVTFFMSRSQQQAREKRFVVGVQEQVKVPGLAAALEKAGLAVKEVADAKKAATSKETDFGISSEAGAAGTMVRVYADQSQLEGSVGQGRLNRALESLRNEHVKDELRKAGVTEKILTPFTTENVNTAPPRRMSGSIFGGTLGFVLVIFMLTGGMYPAIDMTAGEKERRTLEMLLSSAASRAEIVYGKLLATLAAVLTVSTLAVISFSLTFFAARSAGGPNSPFARLGGFSLDPATVGLMLLASLPMAVLSTALILGLTAQARSHREATSYVTPLLFVGMFLGYMTMMPGTKVASFVSFIPIANFCAIVKDLLSGEWSWSAFGITVAANSFFAWLAVTRAVRAFNDEKVLLRG